jgi:hypothetical protein
MDLKRPVHPATKAALVSGSFHPVVLVHLDWPGAPVRVHSGSGTLVWSGHNWLGVNRFGGVTLPPEGMGAAMLEGRMTLGGDPAHIDALLADAPAAYGRAVRVWFGTVTTRGGTTLIGEPFDAWRGQIGQIGDSEEWAGDAAIATVEVEIMSGVSQRSNGAVHHSYEDQQRFDPTDTAGRWVIGAMSSARAKLPQW